MALWYPLWFQKPKWQIQRHTVPVTPRAVGWEKRLKVKRGEVWCVCRLDFERELNKKKDCWVQNPHMFVTGGEFTHKCKCSWSQTWFLFQLEAGGGSSGLRCSLEARGPMHIRRTEVEKRPNLETLKNYVLGRGFGGQQEGPDEAVDTGRPCMIEELR